MKMLNPLTTILMILFVVATVAYEALYKRLDRPGVLLKMRAVCIAGTIFSTLYCLWALNLASRFLDSIIRKDILIIHDDWVSIPIMVMAGIMIHWVFKYALYYLPRRNPNTILYGWHLNEHSNALNRRQYDLACQHLLKASALKTDSVHAGCLLASVYEHFFDDSQAADRYLQQAQAILASQSQPTAHDQAVVECYRGIIQLHRNNPRQAIEHYQKAFDLEPLPFRQKDLDNAKETC